MSFDIRRALAANAAALILATSLGACSGEGATGGGSSASDAAATSTQEKAADAVPTPYDLGDVDPDVREQGKQVVNTLNDLMEFLRRYYATDEDERSDMNEEGASLRAAYDEAAEELGRMDDSWDLATRQYHLDVQCYVTQLLQEENDLVERGSSAGGAAEAVLVDSEDGEVPTPYDLGDVDEEVREHGEQAVEAVDEYMALVRRWYAAEPADRSDMADEMDDLQDAAEEAADQLGDPDDSWNLATRQYYLNLNCYVQQLGQERSDLETADEAKNGDGSSSTSSGSSSSSTSDATSSSEATTADDGQVDPDIKAFGDSYEQFVDQYVDFMNRYASASAADQSSMLTDYLSLVQQAADMASKASELDSKKDTWNTATYQYWVQVYADVTQKLLEAM